MVQLRNDDLMTYIRSEFQGRYEPNFAWKSACAVYQALPGLRGFWPMSVIDYTNPYVTDLSGNGYDLNSTNTPTFGYTNLVPHVTLNGTNQLLSRADGGAANWADITGTEAYIDAGARGLTAYAWVNFDNAGGATESILSKWNTTGNQRAYRLLRAAVGAGTIQAIISVDGAASFSITSTAGTSASTWYFVALQYDPSTELSVWVNGDKEPNAVAVPASIFDSSDPFILGSVNGGTAQYMAGKQSMVALCAAFHSNSIIKSVFNQTRAMFGV